MTYSRSRPLPGQSYPLGATVLPDGVNFALYSRGAERVELCLFDAQSGLETLRLEVPFRTGYVWHCFLHDLGAGQLYGYRVHGRYEPGAGQRFNAAKLLIDPYARALTGRFDWHSMPPFLQEDGSADPVDNARCVPKCVAWADDFDWQGDEPPAIPWRDTVIYETHVRGFSMLHPGIAEGVRGTFRGLASDAAIGHLKRLGITAVELMPVAATSSSAWLERMGLTDYWGYGPIAFMAPDARFSASGDLGGQVTDFKWMVRELHRHGIEVLLDVVYNHTSESDQTGPTLSLRGIDNATYYRLDPMNPANYLNFTGTGNTVNLYERPALRLVLDSLRYWVEEMHVDGFRFDLATTLARTGLDFDDRSSFLDVVYQDPVLSRVKLIAEPWDLGPEGYRAGGFPAPWAEWNDRFRDDVRRFWRGDGVGVSEIGRRLIASPDLFAIAERSPQASINYVTSHDGFTLNDLVSYAHKHNEANGEENRDGPWENYSQNFGVEGPTGDPVVRQAREQQKRNFLATLLLSQGVPMLLGGDEVGRTQQGNNNPYNQDNAISWFDWNLDDEGESLLEFTSRLIAVRKEHPSLRREVFLDGRAHESGGGTLRWLRPDGHEITQDEWHSSRMDCFGMHLIGDGGGVDAGGSSTTVDELLILISTTEGPVNFELPPGKWKALIDSSKPRLHEDIEQFDTQSRLQIGARCVQLLEVRIDP